MSGWSTGEQRARAGLSSTGTHFIRRGPPRDVDQVRVVALDGSVTTVNGVGDDERCDLAWESAHAEQRREEWAGERRTMTDSMRAARRQLPVVVRLDQSVARLNRLTNLRARPIMSQGATTEDAPGGRRPPGSGHQDFDRQLAIVAAAIESLEQALDVEEGIAPGQSAALMTTTEKDRELFTLFAGVKAEEVAAVRPDQGSRATVYRRRKLAGFSPDGMDPGTGMAPTPDRVNAVVVELAREAVRGPRIEH